MYPKFHRYPANEGAGDVFQVQPADHHCNQRQSNYRTWISRWCLRLWLLVGQERLQDPEAESPNPLRAFRIEVSADSMIQTNETEVRTAWSS